MSAMDWPGEASAPLLTGNIGSRYRHGYDISPGTLYPTLHRLEKDGLLISRQQVVEGRTRRMYRVTAAGEQALAEDRKALAELAREILDGR